jgi:hypothetical protein
MPTATDFSVMNGSHGPDTWFGVEVPIGAVPLSGSYSLSGDVANLVIYSASVITSQFTYGDPGFHVHMHIPNNNGDFTMTCVVEY